MAAPAADYSDSSLGIYGPASAYFVRREIESPVLSNEAGAPIFKEQLLFVRALPGGETVEKVVKKDQEADYERKYPKEWKRFTTGAHGEIDGTPLSQFPAVNKAQVRTLEAQHIFSVEQLADCGDNVLQKVGMGALQMREKARAFLEDCRRSASVDSEARILELERQLAEVLKKDAKPDGEEKTEEKPGEPADPKKKGKPRLEEGDAA